MNNVIPFEFQDNRSGRRRCGAAALAMVYRSFGKTADQETIDAELGLYEPNFNRARTFHLSRHAVLHGLAAIPCRLADPWAFLTGLDRNRFRVILNHRIRSDSPAGHYTVFVEANLNDETICLHDPQFGPNQKRSKTELLELWTPFGQPCDITRNVAVLITDYVTNDAVCAKCGRRFSLQPFAEWLETSLQTVFCPRCDAVLPTGRFHYSKREVSRKDAKTQSF